MTNIPIPKHLFHRPRYRGLPIPYIAVMKDDGTPDFRVTDESARRAVIKHRLCQLCGQKLGTRFFFVGGPESAKANAYFEPAAHLNCVIYAMQVCPFIIGRIEHADVAKVEAANPDLVVKVDETFASKRNPLWIIKKASDYSFTMTRDKTLLIVPRVVGQTEELCPETMTADDWSKVREALERL
jgi:hypothetical protein